MKQRYRVETRPQARKENVIQGENYRITLLTEALVRLEYAEDGVFEDRATQMVWYRDFPAVEYTCKRTPDGILVRTGELELIYNEKQFSSHGLSISVNGGIANFHATWHYGEQIQDLGGTARTLDGVNGDDVELDHGVNSTYGFSVLDDSRGLTLEEDGWVSPRKKGIQDLYFFGYGRDYKRALKDFYRLCGKTPMIPRFALGNWWSRYYKYTEESYLELMKRFDEEGIPLTVAVIDMDWHLVDIDPKYGSGWTGFTWNPEFFPDPVRFLSKLHGRGMRTTLNLHPADGIRAYEKAYPVIAEHMQVDQAKEEPVLFDVADPEFLQHYYEDVVRPLEEDGVDFWWMDWQQGTSSRIENLDPLWMLNHYDFLDNKQQDRRPMTFSRYSGPGSHRYPVGFSGDTVITWESLRFQPYFTATAANVGYGWWSHDVGGHMMGYKNDELMARWTQLGVFSPIMRLHSSCSEFNGKEPWRYKREAADAMTEILRFRHRLIPYLYTMNRRNYEEDQPLVQPLYFVHPDCREAYGHANEYYFGSELLVLPVTSKRIQDLNVAREKLWLPEGIWYDIFCRRVYRGGRELDIYRGLDAVPAFAKAGAILVLTDEIEAVQAVRNPEQLHVCAYLGGDGSFTLYEDDNETCAYQEDRCVRTVMELTGDAGKTTVLRIHGAQGETALIPEKRNWVIELTGCRDLAGQIQVTVGGETRESVQTYDERSHVLTVEVTEVPAGSELTLEAPGCAVQTENPVTEEVFDFLNQAEIEFETKDKIYQAVADRRSIPELLSELYAMELDRDLYGALLELLSAY